MKSKAPLVLIEQAVMLLIFAVAAVFCLRAFIWADTRSEADKVRDEALLHAQNMAETLKSCHGDFQQAASIYGGTWDGSAWEIYFDENGSMSASASEYALSAAPANSGHELLGLAEIDLRYGGDTGKLLSVAWQEVAE